MIEDRLRAMFDRYEVLAPDPETITERIAEGYQRARRRRRVWRVAGAACVAAALATAPPVATEFQHGRRVPAVEAVTPVGSSAPVPAGALNYLLLGVDGGAGTGSGALQRADTIMIAHVPASHDHVYLISVPRDLLVALPADAGSRYPGGKDQIGSAYAYGSMRGGGTAGGFDLTARTLSALGGFEFDGGAVFTFEGLTRLVNALGGVDMQVDERTVSVHVGWTADGRETAPFLFATQGFKPVRGVTPQVYEMGPHHFTGWQALDYLRQRDLLVDGDVGRQRHVRQFLVAMISSMRRVNLLTDPARLGAVIQALGATVTLDTGGSSIAALGALVPSASAVTGVGVPTSEVKASASLYEVPTLAGQALLRAVHTDDVGAWIAAHPG